MQHARGRRAETMRWLDPGEKPAVKTTILEDDTEAKRAAELSGKETEGTSGSGTWIRWTDRSPMDDERVGAAAVCLNGNGGTEFRSYHGTWQMEVIDSQL